MINELAKMIHINAIEKGFYENGGATNMGERLALIHGEVSEALEADRNDMYCNVNPSDINAIVYDDEFLRAYKNSIKGSFEEEMADIAMRVFETCALLNIDLENHIIAKMRYNAMREKRHGKKY